MAAPPSQQPSTGRPPDRPARSADSHKPYISADQTLPEFTWSAVLVGAILGIILGASSLYLVLKVGITVSASIPIAVLSITLFRVFSRLTGTRRTTILENNMAQTVGSAGESIAFGVGVTIPALMILGYEMDLARIMVISSLGGLLGVLMMIPLRRLFIVRQHNELPYPEGTACAEVLIAGERGGSTARTVFTGFGISVLYTLLMKMMRLWNDVPSRMIGSIRGASVSAELTPELIGVGYIIGTRIACVMAAGGVLAYWVLIPMIAFFGDSIHAPVFPADRPIRELGPDDIRNQYVLYIGAGAVAAGGIISMIQALPMILGSIRAAISGLWASRDAEKPTQKRTDRDLPMWMVWVGSLLLIIALAATPKVGLGFDLRGLVASLLIVVFGFLFVAVSSRLTGQIGSSSNPVSGMTVATLLLTCLIFLLMSTIDPDGNWIGKDARLMALSIAAVVCIAASNGGTTSQDLKTGYLVGATPRAQQVGLLVGVLTSAMVIGLTLQLLNDTATVYAPRSLPELRAPVEQLTEVQQIHGPGSDADRNGYKVWRVAPGEVQFQGADGQTKQLAAGKYLVDTSGQIRYLVDPGINGVVNTRVVDGREEKVDKFSAPKAQLMALIIDGIMTQRLPWTLVLMGVAIAIVLELCGVPSLPFAVGVYLPMSASMPIFIGGIVRYAADRMNKSRGAASAEMSPGVLLSSGYIAGGTIAGIAIALSMLDERVGRSLDMREKFSDSPAVLAWLHSSWTAIAAFSVLAVLLFLAGSGRIFAGGETSETKKTS